VCLSAEALRVLVVIFRLVSAPEGDLINTKLAGTRKAFRRATV
jgi:hypothetical protein